MTAMFINKELLKTNGCVCKGRMCLQTSLNKPGARLLYGVLKKLIIQLITNRRKRKTRC